MYKYYVKWKTNELGFQLAIQTTRELKTKWGSYGQPKIIMGTNFPRMSSANMLESVSIRNFLSDSHFQFLRFQKERTLADID